MKPTDNNKQTGSEPNQRRAVLVTVAGLASLAGAGWAWWTYRPREVASGAEQALWLAQFERPEGGELALANFRGKPLLINFWATWCPPCIEELPLLDRFFKENAGKGWQVVGLAIDQPSSVRAFLGRVPLSFPVGMAGLQGTELGRSLGNLAGGLPFTVVLGADGRILHRKMGQVKAEDLLTWARPLGNPHPGPLPQAGEGVNSAR